MIRTLTVRKSIFVGCELRYEHLGVHRMALGCFESSSKQQKIHYTDQDGIFEMDQKQVKTIKCTRTTNSQTARLSEKW